MPLYKLTYEYEPSGGNIAYQTTQQVEKEVTTTDAGIDLVTTGLSLDGKTTDGIAIVDVPDTVVPAATFEAATGVRQVEAGAPSVRDTGQSGEEPAADPRPEEDTARFEQRDDMAALLADVSATPGRGFLLYSNLSRCRPFDRDLWLVTLTRTDLDANAGLTTADIVEFYRDNLDVLVEQPTVKIGGYHSVADDTISLFLVASLTDPEEARTLAERSNSAGAMNLFRFELTKASLVVGESSHGPGQVDARFRTDTGETVRSRDLAYRLWHDGRDVSYHPLGVIVDGELYRPVTSDESRAEPTAVGDPIPLTTYRGSPTSRPWQFGVTRHDDELLITQARASPDKFDPILKRFPIETQSIGDDPLVFSHTVSRRLWSEDPLNVRIQSQRSEGLRTQFLYADDDGWHLIQPKALDDQSESFQPTPLDGVSVRSSLLRADTDGETKSTVEHEYRITAEALDACSSLYALSYYEANEESVNDLVWEIADATAYEIIRENPPLH